MSSSRDDLEQLKLVALDGDDLAVVSAHLQDAVVRVGDIAYLPDERRFAMVARRFDWGSGEGPRRRLTGLHFDRVLRCRSRDLDRSKPDSSLNLLAVTFEGTDGPGGRAALVFAGGGTIEVEVECIEARMQDLGPVWACSGRPVHDLESG